MSNIALATEDLQTRVSTGRQITNGWTAWTSCTGLPSHIKSRSRKQRQVNPEIMGAARTSEPTTPEYGPSVGASLPGNMMQYCSTVSNQNRRDSPDHVKPTCHTGEEYLLVFAIGDVELVRQCVLKVDTRRGTHWWNICEAASKTARS